MFRKPMRLEKWIAFDGAFGAEVIEAAQEAPDTDAGEGWQEAESVFETAEPGGNVNDSGGESGISDIAPFDAGVFAPFSIPNNTIGIDVDAGNPGYEVEFEFPMGFDVPPGNDGDAFMPFSYFGTTIEFDVESGYEGSFRADHFFFELGKPDNGSFGFLQLTGNNTLDVYSLIDNNNLIHNQWYIIDQTVGGVQAYRAVKIFNFGFIKYFADSESALKVETTDDGSLRFGFLINSKGSLSGEKLVESVFKSLTFTPKDDEQIDSGAFSLSVWYKQHSGLNSNPDIFGEGANGVFNPSNTPTVSVNDVTQPYVPGGANDGIANPPTPPVTPPGPDPEPETPEPETPDPEIPDPGPVDPPPGPVEPEFPAPPDPDPEPDTGDTTDTDIDPVPEEPVESPKVEEPFVPPVVDSGSADGGQGDSGSDAGSDGDAGGDMGDGDAGSGAAGEAASGDNMMYIYRREDDEDGGRSEREPGRVERSEEEDIEEVAVVEAKSLETASQATILELVRDMESVMNAVRGDKDSLTLALALLRDEYLARDVQSWGGIRNTLRELFEQGNREMETVNRVLEQMHRQAKAFREAPADKRDGMLIESVKELVDSAARRSRDVGAMSDALNAVGNLFRERRHDGTDTPSENSVRELFEQTHEKALQKWAARAMREDPMGKELSELEMRAARK